MADCEVAEGVGCMTRPVMLRSKPNIAVLVSSLMIIAKGIAPSFGRSLVELTAGENASSCFDPHHRRASAGVLDRRFTLKASLSPVIDVALTRDVVGRNTVVRKVDDRVLPAATSQLGGVISQRLSDTLDVIKKPDLTTDELAHPDGHRIGAVSGATDIEERLHRQHRIDSDVPDPAILPRLLQVSGEVRSFEGLGVVAFPNVRIALGVDFQIEPAFLIETGSLGFVRGLPGSLVVVLASPAALTPAPSFSQRFGDIFN